MSNAEINNINSFNKRISKVIKIKRIYKHNKNKNKQSSYNNVNNNIDNIEDDLEYVLKESINSNKNCKYYNCFKNNLIKQKQIDINIKSSKNNKNLTLITQHIESIQLDSNKKMKRPKENHYIKRKKLNLNLISNLDLNSPETKNQFIHNNIANYKMLQKINFFQRLESISEKRFSEFVKEFRKEYYFLDINQFENIFVDKNDIKINSPLTLIFHYCFNPEIKQADSNKNFFEFICKNRGDENYSMTYNKEEIKYIPKYFNNIDYVNNLFNNFSEEELNSFLLGINKWKKTFSFEQKFKYTKHDIIDIKDMTMHDVAKVYFISPLDLIIDYHSYGSDIPMADIFVVISQYRFHCDINFNKKKGKFDFRTNCIVYNTIKLVKKTKNILKKYVILESNKTNKKEIQRNIWPNFIKLIKKEDKNNQNTCDNLFKKYLKNNLYKYSKIKPDEKEYKDFFEKNTDNESIRMSINNFDSGTNFDIISNSNNEINLFNKNIKIINNIKLKETNEQEVKDILFNNNNNKTKEEEIKKEEKENEEIKPKKKRWRKRRILKYGVCIIFALYVIKTIISLGIGYFSNEKIFNIFLSVIIGFILLAIQIKKRRNRNY